MNRKVLLSILVFSAFFTALNIASAYPYFKSDIHYGFDQKIAPQNSLSYVNTYAYQPNYFTTRYFDHYTAEKRSIAFYAPPMRYPKMIYMPNKIRNCR